MTTTYQVVLVGPSGLESNNAGTEDWLNDNIADLFIPVNADEIANLSDESRAARARALLEELEKEGNECEESLQETFASNEGMAVFQDITAIPPIEPEDAGHITTISLRNCLTNPADTEALLRDLEAMLPEVTPPQTPPYTEQQSISDIDELVFLRSLSLPDPEPAMYYPPTPTSMSPVPSPYSSSGMHSPTHSAQTPMLSPGYAPSTPASSPYPASTTSWDSDSTSDPDWSMDKAGPVEAKSTVARSKPYSRPGGHTKRPEDRKQRKKMQNKNAATRYRLKKKAEEDELLSQEDQLSDRNQELNGKVDDLANEIRIIKGLLRDHCKRLGILKA